MESYQKAYLYKRIVVAKLYIDNHFCEKLDLGKIAGSANFSKYHFFRLFKEIYGLTPLHYLTSKRIEASKKLLSAGLTIIEAAHQIGFDSPTSFAAVFKKHTRITPSQFKHTSAQEALQKSANPFLFIPGCFAQSRGWLENSNIKEPV
jgi:AraC-like DNA-binding protein